MIKIPFDDIVSRICEKKGLPKEEVTEKVNEKLKQLSGLVSKEGAAHIIANELGVKLFDFSGELQIKNVLSGMRDVETIGKVLQVYELREFSTEKAKGKVASFVLADQTGSIRVVLWNEQASKFAGIKEGSVVRVKGGYVRDRNGSKEIHLNERGKLIECPGESMNVNIENISAKGKRKKIGELAENDSNTEIFGNIVQIFDPKFFEICPSCGKRAKFNENSFSCGVHGNIMPSYSYVLSMFVDDGTGIIRAVCFRNLVQRLLNMDEKKMIDLKENPDNFSNPKAELLGALIKLNGRAVKNAMFERLEFMVNELNLNPDLDEEISRLNEETRISKEKEYELVDITDEKKVSDISEKSPKDS